MRTTKSDELMNRFINAAKEKSRKIDTLATILRERRKATEAASCVPQLRKGL